MNGRLSMGGIVSRPLNVMTRSRIGAIAAPSDSSLRHRPKFSVQARFGPTFWRNVRWCFWIPEKLWPTKSPLGIWGLDWK